VAFRVCCAAALCLLASVTALAGSPGEDYVMANEPSGERYDWTKTKAPERPWLLPYHQTLVMKLFLCEKDPDGGAKKVYLTFEQALEVIEKLDNITCGIPKIVYLVGWQYDGHDSKYPSWAEVNARLKRAQDETAVDSLRWLMVEARKHHTIVSLHINMFDAYEDSPLWATYVEHDIVAKDTDGNVIFGEIQGGQRTTRISYTQEWKLGFAQKRIDDLLDMLPELVQAKTIHLDAFHGARPEAWDEPISPLLGTTREQEAATQRKIVRYWRDLGLDVTTEGTSEGLIGLVPMAWHVSPVDGCPPTLHCGTPMQAENEVMRDPEHLTGLLDQFCLSVVAWYYDNNATAAKGTQTTRDGDDVCMPALWKADRTLIAYSRDGYRRKLWHLPPDWRDVTKVSVSRITLSGPEPAGDAEVTPSGLPLSLGKGEAVLITPTD
jgi:hypothetical protein